MKPDTHYDILPTPVPEEHVTEIQWIQEMLNLAFQVPWTPYHGNGSVYLYVFTVKEIHISDPTF